MSPVVIDVRRAEDGRDVVHRAVQALVEGELVVFPTETVYGLAASALEETAIAKLLAAKGREKGHALSLAVRSPEVAWDYVPNAPPIARRLARRCWPGPLTLVLENPGPESLVHRLPLQTQQAVCPSGTLGIRVPAHGLMLDVLDMIAGPLALTSANRHGAPDPVSAQDSLASLGNDVRLVLDDGPCRFGQSSTVLLVEANRLHVLREGVVSRAALRRLASFMVVLVCTGNTCRSPIAEGVMRERLAARLGCPIDQLEDRGFLVVSAGSAAMEGAPASPEAIDVMRSRGIDLSCHMSQPVSDRLIRDADLLLTMTDAHRASIIAHWPQAAERTFLVSPTGENVPDPIGGPRDMYEKCADQLTHFIDRRIAEWDLSQLVSSIE